MPVTRTRNSEVSILNRILRPNEPTFSPEAAQDILALDFEPADKDRMRQLSDKARAGTLTAEEDAEAGTYGLVGHLLNVMQSKLADRSIAIVRKMGRSHGRIEHDGTLAARTGMAASQSSLRILPGSAGTRPAPFRNRSHHRGGS
jgi:hypothetical protein